MGLSPGLGMSHSALYSGALILELCGPPEANLRFFTALLGESGAFRRGVKATASIRVANKVGQALQ